MKPSRSGRNTAGRNPVVSSTGFWTRCTILLVSLAPFIASCPNWTLPDGRPGGLGYAEGTSWAEYLLESWPGLPPPDYANAGFRQQAIQEGGVWRVRVDIRAAGADPGAPFNPSVIPDLGVPLDLVSDLSESLSPCRTVRGAVDAVMLFLRRHIRYRERVAFQESPARVFEKREASCVGFVRCACALLRGLGIACREVVGLKLPLSSRQVVLEGGLLHAWIEADDPGAGSSFSDPLVSSGWVGSQYLVLRRGQGLEVGELAGLKGARVVRVSGEDRVFFEPLLGTNTVLWARPSGVERQGALLTGKLLDESGNPVPGKATLSRKGYAVSMSLWEGNFFFSDLVPGAYTLSLAPRGRKPREETVLIGSREKRTLVFYCSDDGPWKAGAADEPGR